MGYRDCNEITMKTASDEYALLRNCYDTDILSTTFGQRKNENDASMVEDGHKCPYPVTIRTKPAGGVQSWNTTDLTATNNYDLCFTLTDPHIICGRSHEPIRTIINKNQLPSNLRPGHPKRIFLRLRR